MTEKLKEYQVIDVLCGGTFYKVRHKVTDKIFAWKAYNCCAYTDEQIQTVVNEVKTISEATSDCLLRYYDTILHPPTKTLYFVLEFNSWRSLQELVEECKVADKHFAEEFVWYLLHELARVCKSLANLSVVILRKCISTTSIFVSASGELRVNCFDLAPTVETTDLMRQLGEVIRTLCFNRGPSDKIKELHYSDDLRDIICFLTEYRSAPLQSDVVLYHPTVLSNLETFSGPSNKFNDILVSAEYSHPTSKANKCDSEKAVELCRTVEPLPRTIFNVGASPIYCNISPKRKVNSVNGDADLGRDRLSPTLAALALELPGYMPRSRRPYSEALEPYNRPQLVSEQTLSQEWMSRLVTLRQREESLNRREKDLISKEIENSPTGRVIPLNGSLDLLTVEENNGITLPAMLSQAGGSRRRRRRRARRQSCGYEGLDSSLSADAGDSSPVVTARKITADNMPRRTIFPEVSTEKVHFKSANPFTESDESVTLTFYEVENVNKGGYEVPLKTSQRDISKFKYVNKGGYEVPLKTSQRDISKFKYVDKGGYEVPLKTSQRDISKFKYLDIDKATTEKRSAVNWSHSSPSKQAKIKNVFNDISNHSSIRKTPSKSSLTSRDSSRLSMMSARSHWSMDTSSVSKVSEGGIFERTRSSIRQTLAQTPVAPDMKKKSRKSLITFKTPFKFMSSNRY